MSSWRIPRIQAIPTLLVSACASAQTGAAPAVAPPILDVRLASAKPVSGFSMMQGIGGVDELGVVYVAPTPLVSDDDVTNGRTWPTPDGLVLQIVLSDSAAARLRRITAANIGQHLAVLVNGRLNGAPIIMASIPRENRVSVGLTLPPDVAEAVRARVAERWPTRGG